MPQIKMQVGTLTGIGHKIVNSQNIKKVNTMTGTATLIKTLMIYPIAQMNMEK